MTFMVYETPIRRTAKCSLIAHSDGDKTRAMDSSTPDSDVDVETKSLRHGNVSPSKPLAGIRRKWDDMNSPAGGAESPGDDHPLRKKARTVAPSEGVKPSEICSTNEAPLEPLQDAGRNRRGLLDDIYTEYSVSLNGSQCSIHVSDIFDLIECPRPEQTRLRWSLSRMRDVIVVDSWMIYTPNIRYH
jgi:hypothetical protein